MNKILWLVFFVLLGCNIAPKVPGIANTMGAEFTSDALNSCSPMLGLLGGICILGGMVLLVISKGTLGWRPLIGGIVFILINYALAMYAHWFFIPVAISTGVISLAWTVRIVMKVLRDKEFVLWKKS